MDAASLKTLFEFNTFANEGIRQALLESDEAVLRRPLDDYWFDSVFTLLTHILSAETVWLERARSGQVSMPPLDPNDFTAESLVDAWRAKDRDWEEWAAAATPAELARRSTWRRSNGKLYDLQNWQLGSHVAAHSANHRGHATVALTFLGIKHGPQEFLDQYPPID
jgi:uncharacterized damage-inducible protein DinB